MPFTAFVLSVVLLYTWLLQPRLPSSYIGVPVVCVLALGVWKAILTREWGLRPSAIWRGSRLTALFTLVGCGIILAAGHFSRTLHRRPDVFGNLIALIVWGAG